MSKLIETDICVIGAGSGGLSVAAGAVQMGARVVLIEGGEMGGGLPEHRLCSVKSADRRGKGSPCPAEWRGIRDCRR